MDGMGGVVQPITLSLPTRVEVELGCDNYWKLYLQYVSITLVLTISKMLLTIQEMSSFLTSSFCKPIHYFIFNFSCKTIFFIIFPSDISTKYSFHLILRNI